LRRLVRQAETVAFAEGGDGVIYLPDHAYRFSSPGGDHG
jgi:hypothetical protein